MSTPALHQHPRRRGGRAPQGHQPLARFRLAARRRAAGPSLGRALDRARDRPATRPAFFAGTATVALYRTETANYIDNLASGAPKLWVVLRPSDRQPPYELVAVTADPAEGEAFTEAGNDLVDTVPMPAEVRDAVEAFIAAHHVERPFFKRQRDARRAGQRPDGGGGRRESER